MSWLLRAWLRAGLCTAVLATGCGDDADAEPPVPELDASAALFDAGDGMQQVCAACDDSCEQALTISSADHVDGPIDYPDKPPAGGPHNPCWGDYGIHYEQPLPAENWVHNLEHGAVVFLYHCPEVCTEELVTLHTMAQELPRVIVTEYTDMPAGFAAVSWGHRLVSECFDELALRAFHQRHFDRAPESVSAGAPGGC
jgi:hypothetical protein